MHITLIVIITFMTFEETLDSIELFCFCFRIATNACVMSAFVFVCFFVVFLTANGPGRVLEDP